MIASYSHVTRSTASGSANSRISARTTFTFTPAASAFSRANRHISGDKSTPNTRRPSRAISTAVVPVPHPKSQALSTLPHTFRNNRPRASRIGPRDSSNIKS